MPPAVSSLGSFEPVAGADTAQFDPADRAWLLRLARDSVGSFVRGTALAGYDSPPARFSRQQACFVTLTHGKTLRGCIGSVLATQALYLAVQHNARAAASRDPRFPPVTEDELEMLGIEISVLTEPQPVAFTSSDDLLMQLRPGVSGVLLQIDGCLSTFLPQVWTLIPDRTEFLNRLAEKGGFPSGAWREPGASISVYQVEHFEESPGAGLRHV